MTIQLEQEQEELLSILVEAHRNLPRQQREPFMVSTFDDRVNVEVQHRGLPSGSTGAYPGDINTLARERLISLDNELDGLVYSFDITLQGFAYYREMNLRDGQPLERIETNIRNYLAAYPFRQKHSKAYLKWHDAEALLWEADSERQLTTIGHLCREALQEFATVLVDLHKPADVETDKTKTVARLRAVLDLCESQLGNTKLPFLKALLDYWGNVNDLIQRQVHGSQRESEPLVWIDGRRVVLQTAIVRLEIDGSLSRMVKPT
jgi:hypothetical protein